MNEDKSKCSECGKILSEEEINYNEKLSLDIFSRNLYMCQNCWWDYADDVLEGL